MKPKVWYLPYFHGIYHTRMRMYVWFILMVETMHPIYMCIDIFATNYLQLEIGFNFEQCNKCSSTLHQS